MYFTSMSAASSQLSVATGRSYFTIPKHWLGIVLTVTSGGHFRVGPSDSVAQLAPSSYSNAYSTSSSESTWFGASRERMPSVRGRRKLRGA